MNVVVVGGALSRPAATRSLPSGDEVVALEVTVREADRPAETVPVVWPAAPAWVRRLGSGDRLVVLGRVRRRYFRAAGVTTSRTEVVASHGAPAGSRRRVAAVLDRAGALLVARSGPLAPSGPAPGGE